MIRLVTAAPAPGGINQRFAKWSRLQLGVPVIDALLWEVSEKQPGASRKFLGAPTNEWFKTKNEQIADLESDQCD